MPGTPPDGASEVAVVDSRPLQFVRTLLCQDRIDSRTLPVLLADLAEAFDASAAGLCTWPAADLFVQHPPQVIAQPDVGATGCTAPSFLVSDPVLLARSSRCLKALTVPMPEGGSALLAAVSCPESEGHNSALQAGGGWVVWLRDEERESWTEMQAAELTVAAMALTRIVSNPCAEPDAPRWAVQLNRLVRQRRLEEAAEVARRLAHDFGNALTGILGFSELAMAQPVPAQSPLHNFLHEIHRSAQAAAQYTNQLRLFSRGRSTTLIPSQLSAVLQTEIERLRGSATGGVPTPVQIDLPADVPALALEPELLQSVLGALLDNACEAMRLSGNDARQHTPITIRARVVQLEEADCLDYYGNLRPGAHVQVVVTDKGQGLAPEAQRRLFLEPFFSTRSRRRGFGLATAYGILCAHHAGINLRPGADGGVEACIVVPTAPAAQPETAVAQPRSTKPASKDAPLPALRSSRRIAGDGERILIVDDDPMILQFVSRTLERAGYRVQAVASGEAGLEAYQQQHNDPFRLVLTDVLMPGLSGVDLAHRLLNREPSIRIVFMSGQVSLEIVQRTLRDTSFEVLHKPFRPEGLLRTVRAALDRPPAALRDKAPPATADEAAASPAALRLAIASEPGPLAARVPLSAQEEGECEP